MAAAEVPLASALAQVFPYYSQQLRLQVPQGWVPTPVAMDKYQSTTTFFPAAQGSQDWNEKLSVQVLRGLAASANFAPSSMVDLIEKRLQGQCAEKVLRQSIDAQGLGPYPAVQETLTCSKVSDGYEGVRSGKGLALLVRAIKGREDFYIVQQALRSDAFDPANPPISAAKAKARAARLEPLVLGEKG